MADPAVHNGHDGSGAPARDIEHVHVAQRRLDTLVAGLDDADMRRPSTLPGWSVGHVLTHLARNADSHVRRTHAARRGETVEQYVGGLEGRARDIDEGAARPAAVIAADVRTSAERLRAAWRDVPPAAWAVVSPDVGGTERALRELPGRRWQEIEVHTVDLGVGPTHRDWPAEFVAEFLPRARLTLAARLAAGAVLPDPLGLDERDELAWLYGRLQPPGLPDLAPWG